MKKMDKSMHKHIETELIIYLLIPIIILYLYFVRY